MKLNQNGMAHILPIVGVVIVLAAATGLFIVRKDSAPKTSTNSQSTEQEAPKNLTSPLPDDLLSLEKVKEIAAPESKGAALTSVELENEDGVFLYKVKLANGTILFFDAKSGAKVTHDSGESESEDGEIPNGFVPSIGYDQARVIALKTKPSGTITKIELELEDSKVVYSVRFSDKARVDVDAKTGEVVRTKQAETENKKPESQSGSSSSGSSSSGSTTTSQPKPSSQSTSGSSSSNSGSSSEPDDNDDDDDDSHSGRGHSGGGSNDD